MIVLKAMIIDPIATFTGANEGPLIKSGGPPSGFGTSGVNEGSMLR
jgi:hypothetical protein